MRKSKNLFYDIDKSNLKFEFNGIIFYFSSDFNLERFKNGYLNYLMEEQDKINAKYHVMSDLKNLLILAYYKKIETRGFRVTFNEEPITNYTLKLIFNV